MGYKKQIPVPLSKVKSRNGIQFSFDISTSNLQNFVGCIPSQQNVLKTKVHKKTLSNILPFVKCPVNLRFHLNPIKQKKAGRKRKLTYSESNQRCTWCLSNKTAQWRKVIERFNLQGSIRSENSLQRLWIGVFKASKIGQF